MSTLQSISKTNKIRVQNIRAKLQSLRSLSHKKIDEKGMLAAIQKSIQKQKYNTINDPQAAAQQQKQFNKKQQDDIIIQDKLWAYFKMQVDEHNKININKTERQKVNGWYKIIKNILNEVDKKIIINQNHKEQMDGIIRSKYRQSHGLYKEIQAIKLEKQLEKKDMSKTGKMNRKNSVVTSRGEKISIIQQNIQSLKEQIDERTAQNQRIKMEGLKMKGERQSFLINLLKNGYYLHDGVHYILQKMVQINYKPSPNDFPSFLDNRSKQYLLKQYNEIINKKEQNNKQEQMRSAQTNRVRSKTKTDLGNIAQQQSTRDIYNNTKDYLVKLLSKQQWKNRSTVTKLPKISQKYFTQQIQKIREEQKKRIKSAYHQQLRQKVKKIEFGIKIQTILP